VARTEVAVDVGIARHNAGVMNALRGAVLFALENGESPVVLFGGKKCSGKSFQALRSLAVAVQEGGYPGVLMNFAGPLKRAYGGGRRQIGYLLRYIAQIAVAEGCPLTGVSTSEIDRIADEIASMPKRRALQRLGTDYGRACNPSVWVDMAASHIENVIIGAKGAPMLITIDDWRFPDELTGLQARGIRPIYAVAIEADERLQVARGCKAGDTHESEQHLADLVDAAGYVLKRGGI